MISIYIGSTTGYSGKSLVTLGLALRMKEDGLDVGLIKPFGRVPTVIGGVLTDGDAAFMKEALGLPDPVEDICPVVHSHDLVAGALRGGGAALKPRVMKAFKAMSKGRDVMLIGGARDLHDGAYIGIPGEKLVAAMDAWAVIVDPFGGEPNVDRLLAVKELIGPRLVGAVINKVPPDGMEFLKGMVGPFLKKKGIPLLGVLPTDKVIDSITIGQLSESLGGRVICREDRLSEFVENFSIGAMDVESALKYFRRTPNKCVITGAHRSDIQLAALETSTKCLVLTGDLLPNDLIIAKATMAGVPIILVKADTLTTVERFEAVLGKVRIREDRKVARARELMAERFDFDTFYKKAGIKRR